MTFLNYPEVFQQPKNLFNKAYFKPVVIFQFDRFQNLFMGDLDKLSIDFCKLSKHITDVTGCSGFDQFRVSNNYGNEFKFEWYPLFYSHDITGYKIFVWNVDKTVLLVHEMIPFDIYKRTEFLQNILRILNRYHDGYVPCAECGREIDYKANSQQKYIDGIYCLTDWKNQYKELAEHEY